MNRRILLLAAGLVTLAGHSIAQTTPVRIRGTVRALEDHALTIEDRKGDPVRITLAPNFTVAAVVPASLDTIKPGAMIGIVGFGPPEHQRAAVISVFPPGSTVAESQFPWDSEPESVMTNAPVTSEVTASQGRTLTVSVKGKPVAVEVPANVVIQTTEPGSAALLVPGAKVIVFAQRAADGTISAARVNAEKDGFAPAN